jgi:hypothetical protein
MDDNKLIRITLIIINILLFIIPIYMVIYQEFWSDMRNLSTNLFVVAMCYSIVNSLVNLSINKKNRELGFELEKQRRNELTKQQIIEREQQLQRERLQESQKLERERLVERQRKLNLIPTYETAGKYEEAAKLCDEFQMWEKAGELRRMAKTTYLISTNFNMGKDGTISVACPTCASTQAVESKSNMVKCQHCGNNYMIPKKILDMM